MVQLPAAAPASRASKNVLGASSRPQLFGQQQRRQQRQQQQQNARMLAAEEAGANVRQGGRAAHGVVRSPPRPPGAGQDPSRPPAAAEDPGPWRWAMEAHMQTIAAGVKTLLERHQDAAPNLNPSMDTPPRRTRRPAEVADQPSLESDGPAARLFYRAPSTIPSTSSRSATGASTIPSTGGGGGGERAEAFAAPRESEPAHPERVQAGAGARREQTQAEALPEGVLAEGALTEGVVGGRVDLPLLLGRAEVAARELRAAREQAGRQVRSRWAEKGRRQLLTEEL